MIEILNKFSQGVQYSTDLLAAAHVADADGLYVYSDDKRQALTEYAYLKLFISWEMFIEDSFLSYSVGGISCLGNQASRILQPQNENHTYDILKGRKAFVEWGDCEVVRPAARLIFDRGGPFEGPLASMAGVLQEAKIIRNSIAHISRNTQAKMEKLALLKLGSARAGITPYEIMMNTTPSGIVFNDYVDKFHGAAGQIANY